METEKESGKRAKVREGGSASRTSGDQSSTDPGGGSLPNKQGELPWQIQRDNGASSQWKVDSQEFPSLGTQKTAGKANGSADPSNTEMDQRPSGHPMPVSRILDREMRPAKDIRSVPRGNRDVRTWGVQEPIASPLSPQAESFTPRPTSEEQQTQRQYADNDLDRSPAKTGLSEMETLQDSIKCKIATIGSASPIEIGKPVAMADVAEPRGPAGTGAGGPVVAGTRLTAVADRTGGSGPRRSETGAPVVTGIRFQIGNDMTEASGPAVTGAGGSVEVVKGFRPVREIAEAGGVTGTGTGRERGSWPSLRCTLQLKKRRVTN